MKLLLTSAGLTNQSIIDTLAGLVENTFEKLRVAFLPTPANGEDADKKWLMEDMTRVMRLGWEKFDIVDVSPICPELWMPRLEKADVIVVGGGSSFYIMEALVHMQLREKFVKLLQEKVYVGISAGSMIAAQQIRFAWDRDFYGIQTTRDIGDGLGLVDFQIMPHWHIEDFSKVTEENIAQLARDSKETIYLIDNNTAIQVIDEKVDIISEGEWKKFN